VRPGCSLKWVLFERSGQKFERRLWIGKKKSSGGMDVENSQEARQGKNNVQVKRRERAW